MPSHGCRAHVHSHTWLWLLCDSPRGLLHFAAGSGAWPVSGAGRCSFGVAVATLCFGQLPPPLAVPGLCSYLRVTPAHEFTRLQLQFRVVHRARHDVTRSETMLCSRLQQAPCAVDRRVWGCRLLQQPPDTQGVHLPLLTHPRHQPQGGRAAHAARGLRRPLHGGTLPLHPPPPPI